MAGVVESWLNSVDAPTAAMIASLRALALAAHPGVTEHIKWNAPSFCLGGDDRITLGVEKNGGVRVVLHRGAKPKDPADFDFGDPAGLARWAAVDRGIMTFVAPAEIAAKSTAIADLFARWLEATT